VNAKATQLFHEFPIFHGTYKIQLSLIWAKWIRFTRLCPYPPYEIHLQHVHRTHQLSVLLTIAHNISWPTWRQIILLHMG